MGLKTRTISTEIVYNDRAETDILFENLEFEGIRISLNPSRDSDDAYITVDCPQAEGFDNMSIFIHPKRVMFAHSRGDFIATPLEIFNALRFIRAARTMDSLLKS